MSSGCIPDFDSNEDDSRGPSDGWPPPAHDHSCHDMCPPRPAAKYDPAPMPPQGPFGVADAAKAVAELCDTARGMLEEVKATTWWNILTKK